MPRRKISPTKEFKIEQLKLKYKTVLDGDFEIVKIENFLRFIIPSLVEPIIIEEISKIPRFLCLFPACVQMEKSLSTKQKCICASCTIRSFRRVEI